MEPLSDLIRRHEEELLNPEVRSSAAKLDMLLSDEFLEFGASGVSYNKQSVLERLPNEPAIAFEMNEFNVRLLSPEVALATYRLSFEPRGSRSRSLRSSIWRQSPQGWQLVFHQGTPELP